MCLKCQNIAKAWTGGVWVDFGHQATGCCHWQIEKRTSASGKGDLGLRQLGDGKAETEREVEEGLETN